jgi:hypothetical protein
MVDGRSPLCLRMLGLEQACIFCNRNHPVIHASQPFLFQQNFAGIILIIASTIFHSVWILHVYSMALLLFSFSSVCAKILHDFCDAVQYSTGLDDTPPSDRTFKPANLLNSRHLQDIVILLNFRYLKGKRGTDVKQ